MTDPYGAPQTPPLNAPGGASPQIGVQPGATAGIVIARLVLVFGTGGGVFVYDPSVAQGDLIASVTAATEDTTGDPTVPGVTAYVVVPAGSDAAAGTYAVNLGSYTLAAGYEAPALTFQNQTTPAELPPQIQASASPAVAEIALVSGETETGDPVSQIVLQSAATAGQDVGVATITGNLIATGTITATGAPLTPPDQYPLSIGTTTAEIEACEEMVNRLCVLMQDAGLVASG